MYDWRLYDVGGAVSIWFRFFSIPYSWPFDVLFPLLPFLTRPLLRFSSFRRSLSSIVFCAISQDVFRLLTSSVPFSYFLVP